jgi:phosphoglycerol geranylgeranyltransferase
MENLIYPFILSSIKAKRKLVALLIDPDTFVPDLTPRMAAESGADLLFVGGSLISHGDLEKTIVALKKHCATPVVIFPGSLLQISPTADAILNLSIISGRNADFLIGQHVIAAPTLRDSQLEILPTGYMLIESGRQTAASYMSGTTPLPHDKDEIAVCTAMAGEMLGLRTIYLDGGSGARETVSETMIRKVKSNISLPLFVGGGIREVAVALKICQAGADLIVIGNAAQEDPGLAFNICSAVHSLTNK